MRQVSKITSLLAMLFALLTTACLKSPKSASTSGVPDLLTISGTVHNPGGQPVSGVNIYLEGQAEAVGITDDRGEYRVFLDGATLMALKQSMPVASPVFHLYFESTLNTALKALGSPLAWSERGQRRLSTVTLDNEVSVSGHVLQLSNGRLPEPAANASISMGRARLHSGADGSFTITGLPAGTLTLTAAAPRMDMAMRNLTLTPGEAHVLETPLVLFPEQSVAGIILPDAEPDAAALLEAGHPFLRSFRVVASRGARFMRYHHDQEALHNPELAPWKPIPERFAYDFPGDGGHVLYFQLTDETRVERSEIYTHAVVLDSFPPSINLVIEDGTGRVARRDIVINMDIPPTAFRMRVSESPAALESTPWTVPQPAYPYLLDLLNPGAELRPGYGDRTLYVQFIDAFGILSPVYHQTVTLDFFPPPLSPVFVIDDGAPQTASRIVRLDITLPPMAYEMRVFESPGDQVRLIDGLYVPANGMDMRPHIWMDAQPSIPYVFDSPGLKTLYVQFRTLDQIVSPIYQQVIAVDPFLDMQSAGFVINGGANASLSRYVTIDLIPPITAVAFQIYDAPAPHPIDFEALPWLTVGPTFSYEIKDVGERTVYVRYRNAEGDVTPAFQQTIFVDPFPPGSGDFLINGGAVATLLPMLDIEVIPPPNAQFVAVQVGAPLPAFTTNWREMTPLIQIPVAPRTGPKTVYLRFRSFDGVVGPLLQRTIFYEPFPYGSAGVEINHDDPTTDDPEVKLSFYALPNVLRFRVADTPHALLSLPLEEYVPTTSYTLPPGFGRKKVYVQFATASGELSPVYSDEIEFVP